MSLLDVGLNMKLKIKLQKGTKWLENDSMHLYSFWENFILTWRWGEIFLFSTDKAWEYKLISIRNLCLLFYNIKSEMGDKENSLSTYSW